MPKKKQTEAQLWATLTLIILTSIAIILAIAHGIQVYHWLKQRTEFKELRPSIMQLDTHTLKESNLNHIKEEMGHKTTKIKQKIEQAKNPLDHINSILMACTSSDIQSLSLDAHRMQLNGSCTKPKDAILIAQKLEQSHNFKNIALLSVQPQLSYQKKSYDFKIQADVNRNQLM